MTEADWLACTDPQPMLEFLRDKASDRKLRLFAVACFRMVGNLVTDPLCHRGVAVAERFADQLEIEMELSKVNAFLWGMLNASSDNAIRNAAGAAAATTTIPVRADLAASRPAHMRYSALVGDEVYQQTWHQIRDAAWSESAALLRHFIGNPFRPYPSPPSWPSSVIELAQALYDRQPCHFALHDALLESGHSELAEHFKEPDHPKGCWAVDLILGKQ
jgi:hypothetical protein